MKNLLFLTLFIGAAPAFAEKNCPKDGSITFKKFEQQISSTSFMVPFIHKKCDKVTEQWMGSGGLLTVKRLLGVYAVLKRYKEISQNSSQTTEGKTSRVRGPHAPLQPISRAERNCLDHISNNLCISKDDFAPSGVTAEGTWENISALLLQAEGRARSVLVAKNKPPDYDLYNDVMRRLLMERFSPKPEYVERRRKRFNSLAYQYGTASSPGILRLPFVQKAKIRDCYYTTDKNIPEGAKMCSILPAPFFLETPSLRDVR